MGVRETAEKIILRRKLEAERIADENLNYVLQDDNIKMLFVRCKELVVEIARKEVDGKDATFERDEYNNNRQLLSDMLKEMGVDKATLKPKYTCPKCNDIGYIKGKECDCLKFEISRELISLSGMDINNMATFSDDFSIFKDAKKVKSIYSKMKEFVDNINTTAIDNIVILGDTGVGKTYLMECMATYALSKNCLIKYSTAFNFNQDMLKYHCAKLEDKQEIMSPYIISDILFIDDLGTENKINNVTNEYLYSVLNERMQSRKKTVITTNLDFGQIQDVYGERVFSRLVHKKHSIKINFVGDDLRVKK